MPLNVRFMMFLNENLFSLEVVQLCLRLCIRQLKEQTLANEYYLGTLVDVKDCVISVEDVRMLKVL